MSLRIAMLSMIALACITEASVAGAILTQVQGSEAVAWIIPFLP